MKLRNYQEQLINATRQSFRDHKRPLVVLPCGGGKTVCFADMAHKHIEKYPDGYVWFLVHRQELVHQTEDTFDQFNISRDHVFIGMVQTVTRNIDRYKYPSLIIFDEAHHAKAKTWYNIIEQLENVPTIGLTATPVRRDGKALGDIFDDLVNGVSFDWLIEHHYLAPYDYYAPQSTDMEFKLKGVDYDLDEFSAQLFKSKIYGEIEKYVDHTKKTIIYAPNIEFSLALCKRLGATHFDGNTPKHEREEIIRKFRTGKIMLLSNVDLIGEGFDVPDCECVILLRPTLSLSLFIQQSTRCLRYRDNKRAVIYDLVGNVYRHGMPTEDRKWSLSTQMKVREPNGEPDILVRQCKSCRLVYSGTDRICPYCGFDNMKTRKQLEEDKKLELEKIEKLERKKEKQEVGMAHSFDQLVAIGKKRGYKNPVYWANMILHNRKKRI